MLKIAIYGKGGIGKSTISSNLSATISKNGKKVLHIGCDPKGDSTRNLIGRKIPTVISILKEKNNLDREDIIFRGFNGIECVETGGPEAGIGCAGRGIITTMEELEDLKIFDEERDIIIYDVLGDVVCGGFAVPMREKYADVVYIVTSSEFMSIFAANNIMKSIKNFSEIKNIKFGGLIHNQRNNNSSINILKIFADMTKSKIIGEIPFSKELIKSELNGKTIAEMYPNSNLYNNFLDLSEKILNNQNDIIPSPLSEDEMEYLAAEILKENIYCKEE
ncbi:nitrogenase iron protein NifH [Fusobacterium simiae]|uniref:Nitrogenase iron protein NifH n=1 Tax=Fusobacterium simiae TaxID=855 RepID=A0ABT4DFX9_FUSSI|nr:nitrogenase iron protein NifH [Fusobacterium simiae]MCY7007505.1 nitrogenase iron protein NifH [Fusobacterium simiae]